jgi:IMP dehydrogenase
MKLGLSFDDVLLVPHRSWLNSRSEVDLSQWFGNNRLRLPIFSAPMDTVTDIKMQQAMLNAMCFGVHHRYCDEQTLLEASKYGPISISPSMGIEFIRKVFEIPFLGKRTVVLDVAHGDTTACYNLVYDAKREFGGNILIVSGNIVNANAAKAYVGVGIDALRVGVGAGAACSTRIVAGVGVPSFTAIQDVRSATSLPIIADGGIKNSGDIVKALAAGADFVMLGRLLAAANEAPGKRHDGLLFDEKTNRYYPERHWKEFRGMASAEALDEAGKERNIEGVFGWIKEVGPVSQILDELERGIRAGFAYLGASDIKELHENAEFIQITNSGYVEGNPRI